jgi:phosphate transport system permease protein
MALPDQDSATPRGEPWVWFSSLGLIVGLVMVLGLLGLVLMNGLSVFWAPPVPVVRLDDGTSLIGQLAQRRIRPGSVSYTHLTLPTSP